MKSRLLDPATLVFAAIVLILVLWIGSGMIGREAAPPMQTAAPIPVVAASWSEARPFERELVLYGELQPTRTVRLRSRTDGVLEEVTTQGRSVQPGDEVARLGIDDREARLAQVQAQLALAQRNADNAQQLADRGAAASVDAQTRQAELEATRAALRAIETEIDNTVLRAPIPGIVNRVILEAGSFVSPGGEVLEIVNNDPLYAVVQVQQSEVASLHAGMPARVRLIGGTSVEGNIRFVSPLADGATRTFRVEIEIPNPNAQIPAGVSAEVTISTGTIDAHYVSAALARLDEHGRTGVLVLDHTDRVLFKPVEFIAADASGVWVGGLSPRERLVTISHGALIGGEQVEVHETPAEYALPQPPSLPGEKAGSASPGIAP